jgi:PhzF family phenazine biosynthesis protein
MGYNHSLYLVDAFVDGPFKGNPAGVCLVDEYPDPARMQALAYYFRWSEISFVKRLSEDMFYIRWFSPKDEAPLCGHATLAASHVIFSNRRSDGRRINFQYGAGSIEAESLSDGHISMTFPLKPVCKCNTYPFSMRSALGIDSHVEIWRDETVYVVVLNGANSVKMVNPNYELIKKVDARAIAVTARGPMGFDFCSRYFAPRVGIYEDPVCGSLHCRLAYYWQLVLGKSKFTAFQASRRSGVLGIEIVSKDLIRLSGRAIIVHEFKIEL